MLQVHTFETDPFWDHNITSPKVKTKTMERKITVKQKGRSYYDGGRFQMTNMKNLDWIIIISRYPIDENKGSYLLHIPTSTAVRMAWGVRWLNKIQAVLNTSFLMLNRC